jgi:diguanylate cyclase (GGDEF)-like protein/PAS domain S-box-containing protein
MKRLRARAKGFWPAAAVAGGFALALLVWMAAAHGAWKDPPVVEHLANAAAGLFAAGACLTAAFKTTERPGRWVFLGSSGIAWAIGEAVWSTSAQAHATTSSALVTFPSASDAWFVAAVPLAAIGVVMFPVPRHRRTKGLQGIFDGVLVAGSLVYASWETVLAPIYAAHHAPLATKLLSPRYPTCDLLLVCLALVVAARSGSKMRSGLEWVTVAFLVLAVPKIIAAHLTFIDGYQGPVDNFLALSRVTSYLILGLGAISSPSVTVARRMTASEKDRVTGSSFLAPYAPFGLAAAITLERVLQRHPIGFVASLWGLALLFVLSARQAIGFFDNMVLNRSLEDRVKTSIVQLRAREARFAALVQNSSDVITVVDENGVVGFQSESVQRVLGWNPAKSLGSNIRSYMHETDQLRWTAVIDRVMSTPKNETVTEWRLRHADGSWRSFQSVVTNLLDEPSIRGLVMNSRDITEQKALEDQLRHQAFHDPLTGLANRALFSEHLEHAVRRRIRTGAGLAVLFIDIDDFKAINDLRGHALGDELLGRVAGRLQETLREADLIARLGGDEFAVLLELEPVDPHPSVVATRLIDNLAKPFKMGAADVHVRASIGVALDHGGAESAEELLRNADLAMYSAKIRGKNTYDVYSSEMHSVILDRMKMESDLRRALEHDEFVLHYQPIFDTSTRSIVDLEALIRWDRGEDGLVMPSDFIDVAEASGLIVPLGAWVLERACSDMARFFNPPEASRSIGLSVNLSRRQLSDPELIDTVRQALAKSGMEASDLTLEMTESAIMENPARAHEVMAQFRELGIKIAIDDFGTGYSSLGSLRDIPLDILKIDRMFVTDIATSPDSARLAKTIMQLANDFELRTVAEGIEKSEQLQELERLGCDSVQGYFLGKPMTAIELAERLVHHDNEEKERSPKERSPKAAGAAYVTPSAGAAATPATRGPVGPQPSGAAPVSVNGKSPARPVSAPFPPAQPGARPQTGSS